jgi:hypothetical protein
MPVKSSSRNVGFGGFPVAENQVSREPSLLRRRASYVGFTFFRQFVSVLRPAHFCFQPSLRKFESCHQGVNHAYQSSPEEAS